MMYAKLIGGAAIALIIFFGYQYVTNLQEDNAILTGNVAKLEVANDVLFKEKEQIKENLVESKERVIEVNKKFLEIETEKNKIITIFADHDFTKLVEKKPGLITRKMNKATKNVFKEIENESKE